MSASPQKSANGVQVYEPPPLRNVKKKFNFWRGIYNKDKNYILGRTPKNWGQLLIFYSIFYLVLGILFAICMKGLMSTIDEKTPTWLLHESRIGINPGLGFRPISKNLTQGSLIWFDSKNATEVGNFTEWIDEFLTPYKAQALKPPKNSMECNFTTPAEPDHVCRFDLDTLGNCTAKNAYGYNTSQPCVFLKLNRIIQWTPEVYNGSNKPDNMPDDLKNYIDSLPADEQKQIFVSCAGQYPKDKDAIGKIHIEPVGFPFYYYPYTNIKGYLSPLVSVQFLAPKIGEIINVECIAWAPNIIYHGGERDRQGSVHFEILVDAKL